jgi:hypothetical protein
VAGDMQFIKSGISMLFYHVGLDEEFDSEDIESVEVEQERPNGLGGRQPSSRWLAAKANPVPQQHSLWQEIPKSFVSMVLIVLGLFVCGIVILFTHEGTASTGAAAFFLILFGLTMMWLTRFLCSEYGYSAAIDYFRNNRQRQATIQTLPRDIRQLKTDMKELLGHYRLTVDEIIPTGSNSSPQETASNSRDNL